MSGLLPGHDLSDITVTDSLPPVTAAQRERLLAAPRTTAAHRAMLTRVPAMRMVETGGRAAADPLPESLSVVAWNLERGLFPEASAARLADGCPGALLVDEALGCGEVFIHIQWASHGSHGSHSCAATGRAAQPTACRDAGHHWGSRA